MTTQIAVHVNGNFVAEGKITIQRDGEPEVVDVKVGPGSNIERRFGVPHGSALALELTERDATEAEVAEVEGKDRQDNEGGTEQQAE
jgi:hypothetical protein